MSASLKYSLDANIFIEAGRRYYAFDICPGFWASLVWHHQRDRLDSIDRVRDELLRGNDALSEWASTRAPTGLFVTTSSQDILDLYGQIITWSQSQSSFQPQAIADFANSADAWLVAYAKARSRMLVTHEVHSPDARRRIPIPNVCSAFGVQRTDTFAMLRDLGVSLTWQPPASS
ncbi:MAG TPA: DUF4411 family protein [Verrucomicrobiota bacterium]|nr:DUF4411 family protein [Verrucomicrobiota bacterium]HRT58153.1 DUF4411 family protein [Candidatus Paceibacterota bacterium]